MTAELRITRSDPSFINYLVGFLTGYFEAVKDRYDECFFQTVQSNLIVFGYKDGCFFDNQYETEEEFREAIQELLRNDISRACF